MNYDTEIPKYCRHNDYEICGFFGGYRFLSNFYVAHVYYEGMKYPSSEHAYQAAKTLDLELRKPFQNAQLKPAAVKSMGREIACRPDWEDVKFDIMAAIVMDKFFRHRELRNKLLATSQSYLEETNHWKDITWGVYNGRGTNFLGKILMITRQFWTPKSYEAAYIKKHTFRKHKWIGIDFDRTIAHRQSGQDIYDLGEPVQPMLQFVKSLLAEGYDVRIFTARHASNPQTLPLVEAWCEKHIGRKIPITSVKDNQCEAIFDDKAFRVQQNTGVIL